MTTTTKTVADALQTLEEIVAEFGEDHVYNPVPDLSGGSVCAYVHHGRPSCLIGHVFDRWGLLGQLEANNYVGIPVAGAGLVPRDVLNVLCAAQTVQDCRGTWGSALREARKLAANIGLLGW